MLHHISSFGQTNLFVQSTGGKKISLFAASLNILLVKLPALLLAQGECMAGHMGVITTL